MKRSLLLEALVFPDFVLGHIQTQSKFQQTPRATLAKKIVRKSQRFWCVGLEGPDSKQFHVHPITSPDWPSSKRENISWIKMMHCQCCHITVPTQLELIKASQQCRLKKSASHLKPSLRNNDIRIFAFGVFFFSPYKREHLPNLSELENAFAHGHASMRCLEDSFVGVAARVGKLYKIKLFSIFSRSKNCWEISPFFSCFLSFHITILVEKCGANTSSH